jgi:hypothetical protein
MKRLIYILQISILFFVGAWMLHSQNPSGDNGASDFFTYGVGVYVSEAGSDYYEGTREKPFRTLKKALDYIKISGKKIIFVDGGTYFIDSTLRVKRDLEILGSLYWKQGSDKQEEVVIESWAPYGKGESMFSIENAQFAIKGITIKDMYKHFPFILAVKSGALYCDKVSFHYSSQGKSGAIYQEGGALTLHNSFVYTHDSSKSQALLCDNTEVKIINTEIVGPKNANDFTAVVCAGGSIMTADNLTISPGQGKRLTGISLSGSTFKLNNSKILSGASSHKSICLEAKASTIILNQVVFECDAFPYKITAISTSESQVTVHHSRFLLQAHSGLQAIYMNRGTINLQNSYFKSKLAQEYMYTVNLEEVKGDCFNNILEGGNAPDSVNIVLSDAPTRWLNNTIIGGTGNNMTIGVLIRGVKYPILINNIITRKKPATGIALYLTTYEETSFYLLANNLSGWEIFLKYANVPKTKNYTAVTTVIRTIEELNHYDLVPFGGTIDINISETYENTFQIDESPYYRLKTSSRCIDAGLDVNTQQFKGPAADYEGNQRPNLKGNKPFYDIGAFEYQ